VMLGNGVRRVPVHRPYRTRTLCKYLLYRIVSLNSCTGYYNAGEQELAS
jgi:hypothetical protein